MRVKEFGVADIVPVDMVNNALLAISWCTGLSPTTTQPIIYNFTGGSLNPLTWHGLCELGVERLTECMWVGSRALRG